jgi:hypothetical protein
MKNNIKVNSPPTRPEKTANEREKIISLNYSILINNFSAQHDPPLWHRLYLLFIPICPAEMAHCAVVTSALWASICVD